MANRRIVTVRSAIALGIGSMVGAGIFALLGEAASLAGSLVCVSLLMAGVIALLTGYSFVQMGIRFSSRDGVVEYLVQSYGAGLFPGACSISLYIAQLIGMSMIALAFGKYSTKLVGIADHLDLYQRALGSSFIVVFTALHLVGSRMIGGIQRIIVVANLVLLSVADVGLLSFADGAWLSLETWPSSAPIIGSSAPSFFALTGIYSVAFFINQISRLFIQSEIRVWVRSLLERRRTSRCPTSISNASC